MERDLEEYRKANAWKAPFDAAIKAATVADWERWNGCRSTDWDFVHWPDYGRMGRDLCGWHYGDEFHIGPDAKPVECPQVHDIYCQMVNEEHLTASLADCVKAVRLAKQEVNASYEAAGYTRVCNGEWKRDPDEAELWTVNRDKEIRQATTTDWERWNGCPSTDWDFVQWRSYDHMERDFMEWCSGECHDVDPDAEPVDCPQLHAIGEQLDNKHLTATIEVCVKAMRLARAEVNASYEAGGWRRLSKGAWKLAPASDDPHKLPIRSNDLSEVSDEEFLRELQDL